MGTQSNRKIEIRRKTAQNSWNSCQQKSIRANFSCFSQRRIKDKLRSDQTRSSLFWFQLMVTDELAPHAEEETHEALCRWHEATGGGEGGKRWTWEEEAENPEPRSRELRGAAEDCKIKQNKRGSDLWWSDELQEIRTRQKDNGLFVEMKLPFLLLFLGEFISALLHFHSETTRCSTSALNLTCSAYSFYHASWDTHFN